MHAELVVAADWSLVAELEASAVAVALTAEVEEVASSRCRVSSP